MIDDSKVNDLRLAAARLRAIATPSPQAVGIVSFIHEGVPVPWERVGVSNSKKGGRPIFYTPKATRQAEQALAWRFRSALGRRDMFTDTVAVVLMFYIPTRRRKDVDNLAKLVLDAATQGGIWKDDAQVIAQATFLELDAQRPRTVVALCASEGTLTRAPLLMAEES